MGDLNRTSWIPAAQRAGIAMGALVSTVAILGQMPRGQAQLIPDTSLGAESSTVIPGVTINGAVADRIDGGAERGSNLFHSFSEFNIDAGQRVYFANPESIDNILSRVTGTNTSNIDGLLGVDGPANLFFLNPNGIVFGPGAELDIHGSFTASTAASLPLANGGEFRATPLNNELLTFSTPLGVQFNHQPQGDIDNQGDLTVDAGERLTLFGDNVLNSGSLTTPSGTVEVIGNHVSLADQATIGVSGQQGGQVLLSADTVDLSSGLIDISGTVTGGDLAVYADKSLTLGVTVDAAGGGHALFDPPTFTVNAEGANTIVSTLAGGNATISASDTININAVVNSNDQTNANTLTLDDENGDGRLAINLNAPILLGANQTLTGDGSTVNVNVTNPGIVQNGIDVAAIDGTVNLAAGNYQEGQPVTLNRNVTLSGAGAGITTLNGANAHRVLQVNGGTVRVSDLTITNGRVQAGSGGGIQVGGNGNFTLANSTVANNTATGVGGGISLVGSADVGFENSTIANNAATGNGGGVDINFAPGGFELTVNNSTFSNNSAGGGGGGFSLGSNSSLNLNQSTVTENIASSGSGISNIFGGQVTGRNSIVTGNNGGNINGTFTNGGNNLIDVSVRLAPLGDYGGPTQTHALLPGSVAIDSGSGTGTDQRGIAVVNNTRDIGAFESRGFTITANTASTPQTTNIDRVFANPLTVTVTSAFGEPVENGIVVFTAPETGATATLSNPTAILNNVGQASVTASANAITGNYAVTSNILDTSDVATFNLKNSLFNNITVDILADENDNNFTVGDVSLREAITIIEDGGTIEFTSTLSNGTITLGSGQLTLDRNLTIDGAGAPNLEVSGNNESRVFDIQGSGNTATIQNLRITNGNADLGGGLRVGRGNRLVLGNSRVENNAATTAGAGIYSEGTLQISGSTITDTLTLNAGANDIILDGPNNQFGTLELTGNNVTIQESSDTDLGPSTVSGTLEVTSSGSITDSGDIAIANTTTLIANNNIILDSENNRFGLLNLTGNNVLIQENGTASLGETNVPGDLTMIARDINIGPGFSVNGNLSLQPYQREQAITIGSNAPPGLFTIDPTEIEQINTTAPNTITIGRSSGEGILNVAVNGTDPFDSPLTLQSPEGTVAITSGAQPLSLSDVVVEARNISLTAIGNISLANIQLLGSPPAGSIINIDTGLSQTQIRSLILEGSGGINAPLGFVNIFTDIIDATGANNQDIVTGAVTITSTFAQTLDNIFVRDSLTAENDIISTGFAQDPSGFNPAEGINELPLNFSDASDQIAADCRANASSTDQSEFVVTGRGGLPTSPSDPLSAHLDTVPWVTSPETDLPSSTISTAPMESSSPTPLREAQGWITQANGQIFFVTTPSTESSPYASGTPTASLCAADIDS
ncbi:filamentous hemagglutinin N-terminal domain-containing protein [Leptothoe sp. EHU-05/26/07-4]